MVSTRSTRAKQQVTSEAALAGLLALLVDEREERVKGDKDARKTEILLADAGLSIEDIAAVMGKNYDAVRVAINRARAK